MNLIQIDFFSEKLKVIKTPKQHGGKQSEYYIGLERTKKLHKPLESESCNIES